MFTQLGCLAVITMATPGEIEDFLQSPLVTWVSFLYFVFVVGFVVQLTFLN